MKTADTSDRSRYPSDPEFRRFAVTRESRDRHSREKDAVILPLLSAIRIGNPVEFRAVIMPCLYGPEAYMLVERGVPPGNIFAVEKDRSIHGEIRKCRRHDRSSLAGMSTTMDPMPVQRALDRSFVLSRKYDLIYLDFFGQPCGTHYHDVIKKIFGLRMLKDDGVLILNFGRTRTHKGVGETNAKLVSLSAEDGMDHLPTRTLVRSALHETGHPLPPSLSVFDRYYKSSMGNKASLDYVTTVADFGGRAWPATPCRQFRLVD